MKTVSINFSPESPISRSFEVSDYPDETSDNSMPLYHLNTTFNGWAIIEVRIIGGFIYFPNRWYPPDVWRYLANFFQLPVAPLFPASVRISDTADENTRVVSGHVNSFGFFIFTNSEDELGVVPHSHYEPLIIDGRAVDAHSLTDCLVSPEGRIFPIEKDDAKNWLLSPQFALRKNPSLHELYSPAGELKLMPYLSALEEIL